MNEKLAAVSKLHHRPLADIFRIMKEAVRLGLTGGKEPDNAIIGLADDGLHTITIARDATKKDKLEAVIAAARVFREFSCRAFVKTTFLKITEGAIEKLDLSKALIGRDVVTLAVGTANEGGMMECFLINREENGNVWFSENLFPCSDITDPKHPIVRLAHGDPFSEVEIEKPTLH